MKTLEELNISLERDIIYTTEEFHSTIASYTTIMKSDKLPSIDLYDDNDDDDTTVTYGDVQWMHIGGIISDEVKEGREMRITGAFGLLPFALGHSVQPYHRRPPDEFRHVFCYSHSSGSL